MGGFFWGGEGVINMLQNLIENIQWPDRCKNIF